MNGLVFGYLIVMAVLEVLLIAQCVLACRKKPYFYKSLLRLLLIAIVTSITYFVFLIVRNESVAKWCGVLYFIGLDWLTFQAVVFSMEYCKANSEKYKPLIPALPIVVTTLDCIMMIATNATGNLISVTVNTEYTGHVWLVKWLWPYFIHAGICYIHMMFSIVILLWKTKKVSSLYKSRYHTVAIAFSLGILLNAVCYLLKFPIDLSILQYTIASMLIIIFSIYIIPRKIRNNTVSNVIAHMNSGICCFDNDGQNAFCNSSFREIMNRIHATYKNAEDVKTLFPEAITRSNGESLECDRQYDVDGKTIYLKQSLVSIRDKKDIFVGSFFEIVDQTEEIAARQRELYKATHDSLTGLYNRETFFTKVKEILEEDPDTRRYLICSDIKDFKLINDLFGVEVGDAVLRKQVQLMKSESTDDELLASRITGDKFALVIPEDRFDHDLIMRNIVRMQALTDGSMYKMHIYVGVYEILDATENVQTMCDKARIAIESIKGDYNTHIAYYDGKLREELIYEKTVMSEFENALECGQFCMYLQPQVHDDGKINSAEALVRWAHPTNGLIPPGKYIPILEKTGLVHKLDMYIWEKAIKKIADWKVLGINDMQISVNISTNDFYHIDIYKVLTGLVEKYDIDVNLINLEITESALMKNYEENIATIDQLKNYGFKIEIDDFGSGYSSLNMLKDIGADVLKIDMLFLRETENKIRSRKILKSIIDMSKALGMPVIIEGVETDEQLSYLKEMKCDMYQGYYYSKPIPVNEFEEKYLSL